MSQQRSQPLATETRSVRASVASVSICRSIWLVVATCALLLSPLGAQQQLLDRVVARVGNTVITQTDVESALALGIVQSPAGPDAPDPLRQLIDRWLMLAEVSGVPEPADAAVSEVVAKMKATAGANLNAVMKRTGVDEQRLTEIARDTLRLQGYLGQRFGTGPRADQQMTRWLEDLRARGGVMELNPRR